MTQPIYKLWQARFTQAWYELPSEEQQRLLGLAAQALNTVGGKEVMLCSAAWSNEQWPWFGLEEFPDVAAVQRQQELLSEFNWSRYLDSRTILGTEFSLPES